MANLLTTSKSFLEWAQSLPHTVIPAGLESDLQEAIAEVEAVEHAGAVDLLPCGHTADNLVVNAVTSWCDACETASH